RLIPVGLTMRLLSIAIVLAISIGCDARRKYRFDKVERSRPGQYVNITVILGHTLTSNATQLQA
ncbi:hypothetical protein PFISCL1PPCAC_27898, partial [Pristionchus fissidentatus]